MKLSKTTTLRKPAELNMKQPTELSRAELDDVLTLIQRELFWDDEFDKTPEWNAAKMHDLQDLPRRLASILDRHGLTPSQRQFAR